MSSINKGNEKTVVHSTVHIQQQIQLKTRDDCIC